MSAFAIAVEFVAHSLWLHFNWDNITKNKDETLALYMLPFLFLTEFFILFRTVKIFKNSIGFLVIAFLFGLSLVDLFSIKSIVWSLLIAQRSSTLSSALNRRWPAGDREEAEKGSDKKEEEVNSIPLTLEEWSLFLVLVGSWASSIVIPLDWERTWQKWPIPNVIGSELGYLAGLLLQIGAVLFSDSRKDKKQEKKD